MIFRTFSWSLFAQASLTTLSRLWARFLAAATSPLRSYQTLNLLEGSNFSFIVELIIEESLNRRVHSSRGSGFVCKAMLSMHLDSSGLNKCTISTQSYHKLIQSINSGSHEEEKLAYQER